MISIHKDNINKCISCLFHLYNTGWKKLLNENTSILREWNQNNLPNSVKECDLSHVFRKFFRLWPVEIVEEWNNVTAAFHGSNYLLYKHRHRTRNEMKFCSLTITQRRKDLHLLFEKKKLTRNKHIK